MRGCVRGKCEKKHFARTLFIYTFFFVNKEYTTNYDLNEKEDLVLLNILFHGTTQHILQFNFKFKMSNMIDLKNKQAKKETLRHILQAMLPYMTSLLPDINNH